MEAAKFIRTMQRRIPDEAKADIVEPDAVLGLATGGTPTGAYAQLVEWYRKGISNFPG